MTKVDLYKYPEFWAAFSETLERYDDMNYFHMASTRSLAIMYDKFDVLCYAPPGSPLHLVEMDDDEFVWFTLRYA